MKVMFDNAKEYRDFLGSDFEDIAGSGGNREQRFDRGMQIVSELCDDIELDLEGNWIGGDEFETLGLIRH
jgi:hypothetical protein